MSSILENYGDKLGESCKKSRKIALNHYNKFLCYLNAKDPVQHVYTDVNQIPVEEFKTYRHIFGMFPDYLRNVATIPKADSVKQYISKVKMFIEDKNPDSDIVKNIWYSTVRATTTKEYFREAKKTGKKIKESAPSMTAQDLMTGLFNENSETIVANKSSDKEVSPDCTNQISQLTCAVEKMAGCLKETTTQLKENTTKLNYFESLLFKKLSEDNTNQISSNFEPQPKRRRQTSILSHVNTPTTEIYTSVEKKIPQELLRSRLNLSMDSFFFRWYDDEMYLDNDPRNTQLLNKFKRAIAYLMFFLPPNTVIEKRPNPSNSSYETYIEWKKKMHNLGVMVRERSYEFVTKIRDQENAISNKRPRKLLDKFEGMYERLRKAPANEFDPLPAGLIDNAWIKNKFKSIKDIRGEEN